MTQEVWGQDIEQVRALAGLFESKADELESSQQQVTNAVFSFEGYGANVDQLRAEWSDHLAPSLSTIAEALRSAGDKATRNADEQEGTSDSYDGSGGNPFAGVSTQGSSDNGDDDGGPLDWLGDKAGDLWDAGGDALDWAGDKAGDLWDAGTDAVGNVWDAGTNLVGNIWDAGTNLAGNIWDAGTNLAGNIWDAGTNLAGKLWDAGSNAVDWLGDRGSDALDWIGDRASAIGGAFENVGDSGLQLWDATGGAILDGEWPRTTEVLASTIRLAGATVGAGLTAGSLGMFDPKVFDDGEAYAGDPQDVLSPRNPSSVADIARTVTDAYGTDGNVRVTTVEGPDGPRVIVSVPGTEAWNPSAGDNPMDLTGNLVTAGGSRSTMSEAVILAMENANIPPGAEVMLVGHSQGGMTVADLTSDSAFVDKYNVTHAMTYGSPIDSAHIDPSVNVLEMQHQHDVVPRLDLGDSRFPFLPGGQNESGNHTSVTFDDPGSAFNAIANHDHANAYPTSMENSTDPGYLAYQESLRQSGFLSDGSNASVSAQDIHVGRKN
ncbi:hypothetical protein [Promicromonospora sp. NPDC060271]|uniref:hypothetical protein n=1 Tax=Promicromonospora sp. NPDC060271 TaxID=3347089 RepID=UPI00364D6322